VIAGFYITKHAQDEKERREIPEDILLNCLNHPQQVIMTRDERVVYQSTFQENGKDYLLRIVVDDIANPKRVITMYKTKKIEKYWENKDEG